MGEAMGRGREREGDEGESRDKAFICTLRT